MPTLAESLTQQFYSWERRGRGWQLHGQRVVLEPAFQPFIRQAVVQAAHDDAREPPLWERALNWFRSRRQGPTPRLPDAASVDVLPEPDHCADDLTEIQVRLPAGTEITGELSDQLLLSLAALAPRVSFELLSQAGHVSLQFVVPERGADALSRTIEAFVPDAVLSRDCLLVPAWTGSGRASAVVEFGLRQEFMLPLATRRSLAVDPLLPLFAALEGIGSGEVGVLQVLLQPVRPDWAVSALRAMSDGEGRAFFKDAPETLSLTREKLSRPLLASVIRVAATAQEEDRAWEVARGIGRALLAVHAGGANDLIPLENDGYDAREHEADVLDRACQRSGMLLSSSELSMLVHLPASAAAAQDLRVVGGTTKEVPSALRVGEVVLGENRHRGHGVPVALRAQDRLRHTHLIGATGTGKSTFLLNLIRQDLEAGRGLALLDPHGDLADEVLGLVPENRMDDTVLFDPADEEFPVGFNVLDAHSDREKELLSSDLVGVFKRFSTSWGDQMSAVLGNAVLAFLESADGGSLLDMRRFLMDAKVRAPVLATVSDPLVVSFWKEEFPRLVGRPQMPIITRLDAFLRPKCIRNIVCQRQSRFDLGSIMDTGGIFIARLSQGAIGEQNAYLLGSLLVAKFQQASLARERQAESERRPFYLYLDEFHHFTTPSIASLLSGARKYRLGLVLAHQELRQLAEYDIRSAVLANAGTRVCFRVGDEDARTLSAGFRAFDASDLMSLGVGEAVCRVGQADQDFNLRCPLPPPAEDDVAAQTRQAIRETSRRRYAQAKAEVEEAISPSAPVETPITTPSVAQPPLPAAASDASSATQVETGAAPPPRRARRPRRAKVPATLGKGGPEHKYLQSLIKNYAESKGFLATIEAPTDDGGAIDVLLVREDVRIACEVSITTEASHEAENARKCFAAGAGHVLIVSPSAAGRNRIMAAVQASVSVEESERVTVVPPTEVIAFLDEVGPAAPETTTVRGYKVRTRVAGTAPAGAQTSGVARTIAQALRRLRSG